MAAGVDQEASEDFLRGLFRWARRGRASLWHLVLDLLVLVVLGLVVWGQIESLG